MMIMKRLCTGLFLTLAIGCCLTVIPPLSARAVGIMDLDGDSRYTIADAILLIQVLNGISDYNGTLTDLDITGDYIVDTIDANVYLDYLTEN